MITEDNGFIFENFRPSLFDQLAITETFASLIFLDSTYIPLTFLRNFIMLCFYAINMVRSGDNLKIIEEYGSDYFLEYFDQSAITETTFASLIFWIPDGRFTYNLDKLHYFYFKL